MDAKLFKQHAMIDHSKGRGAYQAIRAWSKRQVVLGNTISRCQLEDMIMLSFKDFIYSKGNGQKTHLALYLLSISLNPQAQPNGIAYTILRCAWSECVHIDPQACEQKRDARNQTSFDLHD